MKFLEKHRKLVAIVAVIAIAVATISVGGFFSKRDPVTATSGTDTPYVNGTMMQYFEWDLANSGTHWNMVADQADELAEAGITALWLPPAYKAEGQNNVGYSPYDLYDLGEFNQKGTVRTKYGTKDEYLNAINRLHANGIQVYADIVLNHKGGADEWEYVDAVKVDYGNRNYVQCAPYQIGAWTKFNFAGRGDKYSSFKWNSSHFDGVDWDQKYCESALYKFADKNFDWKVDSENGNYDYLMYADVDFDNREVVDELKSWGEWYVNYADLDGFRLDAVKHIKYSFYSEWLSDVRQKTGKELFSVGEYWSPNLGKLQEYIYETNGTTSLFDVPLHYNFNAASNSGGHYDMRNIFNNTLVAADPAHAVTFVDNHDSQLGQSLQSWVSDWFKPIAYTLILTREGGYPCVFYGDYYGLQKYGTPAFKDDINALLKARTDYAYGTQHEYIDDANVIGWTREGDAAHPNSGLAALVTDGAGGSKYMYVGTQHAGEEWYDITGHVSQTVTINESGYGSFSVNGGSNSVWVSTGNGGNNGNGGSVSTNNSVTVYYETSWDTTYAHYQIGNGGWTDVPGVQMNKVSDNYAKVTIELGASTKANICFNDGGNNWDSRNGNNYSVGVGTYTISKGSVVSGEPEGLLQESNKVTVYYHNNWNNSYIHYQIGNGEWTAAPGVKMEDVTDEFASITIDMGSEDSITVCFNDGNNTWDSNHSNNYKLSSGTYTIKDKAIINSAPVIEEDTDVEEPTTAAPSANTVTLYYYNNWSNTYAHYQVGSGEWTAAPGVKMEDATSAYAVITIDLGSADSLNICFNNGSGSWDNNNNSNYTINAGTYTIKGKNVTEGAPKL